MTSSPRSSPGRRAHAYGRYCRLLPRRDEFELELLEEFELELLEEFELEFDDEFELELLEEFELEFDDEFELELLDEFELELPADAGAVTPAAATRVVAPTAA
jgi:hypothetical protein